MDCVVVPLSTIPLAVSFTVPYKPSNWWFPSKGTKTTGFLPHFIPSLSHQKTLVDVGRETTISENVKHVSPCLAPRSTSLLPFFSSKVESRGRVESSRIAETNFARLLRLLFLLGGLGLRLLRGFLSSGLASRLSPAGKRRGRDVDVRQVGSKPGENKATARDVSVPWVCTVD